MVSSVCERHLGRAVVTVTNQDKRLNFATKWVIPFLLECSLQCSLVYQFEACVNRYER